jgi:AAHS family 4-hydroxybenzoate transporter-like MFS transporter
MNTVDVGAVLDEGRWTGYQKLLVLGTALAIILDGVDNQLLPNAVPAMMEDWALPRGPFVQVLALGPFGMMIGGAAGGVLGDRFGRRTALLGSVLSFGALTLAIAWANSLFVLGALRFLAGVGLGGAMPNAAALVSEYVPARHRPFAVTLTIVCIPLGGLLAASLSAYLIPEYGWRTLFLVGGAVPAALGLVLFKVLPESPHYLAGRPDRWNELTRVMRRMGHDVPADAAYVEAAAKGGAAPPRASLATLFGPEYRRDTVALFSSFFFCLMVNYVVILLLPSMLVGEGGFTQPAASSALAAANFGGVGGAILGGLVIQRLGSRATMLGMSAAAIATALVLAVMRLDPSDTLGVTIMLVLAGALLNGVQTTMYALAAHVYPTGFRSTGVGAAVAFGRIGNVLAAYVGSFAIDVGGTGGYFTSWAALMAIVLVSLAAVTRHVPRTATRAADVTPR